MASNGYLTALSSFNFSAAVKSLDKILKERLSEYGGGKDLSIAQLHFNRGFCFQKLELYRKALKEYEAAIRAGGDDPKLMYRQGQVLFALGKKAEARRVWQSVIERATPDFDADVLCMILDALANPSKGWKEQTQLTNGPVATPVPSIQPKEPTVSDDRLKSSAEASTAGRSEEAPSSSSPSTSVKQLIDLMNPQAAVGMAVEKVNEGKYNEAESILDEIVRRNPKELGARVARGTARALMRKLEDAVEDFSVAIEILPQYPDSWKRRGQARSALGDLDGALADLKKSMELTTDVASKSDSMVETGMIYQKQKDFRRAVEVLLSATKLNDSHVQCWNLIGLCKTSLGDIEEGVAGYKRAISLDPKCKDAWFNMCQALKESGQVRAAEDAYWKGRKAEQSRMGDGKHIGAYRVMASMYQGLGNHMKAIEFLDEALSEEKNEQQLECIFLRAACYHALGFYDKAVKDYMNCLTFEKKVSKEEGQERQQLVVLAFYQKELALYMHHKLDIDVASFCPDVDWNPVFKELWCKKAGPTRELITSYAMQQNIPSELPPPPPPPDSKAVAQILEIAENLGSLLQNSHQGFLPNRRQQRAAGCAALELAQAVKETVELKKKGQGGLQVVTEGSSGGKGSQGTHLFGWRDAMDLIVKWRQLSEPNDQVVWVDLLTPSEFEAGFGSHTPMFSGQTKCVRYYMNFERALAKQKEILLATGLAYNAQNESILVNKPEQQEAIRKAKTARDMYAVIRQDSWVVVKIASLARPDSNDMEGTRLTLVKVPNQPDAFEFSIRTPVTPPRWKQFEEDLQRSWDGVIDALIDGDKVTIAQRILTYVYYWYNFMPLARGTAASGHTCLLALFLAAGIPVTVTIPEHYQIDWEAILEQHPDIFANELCQWFVPDSARPEKHRGSTRKGSKETGIKFPDPSDVPSVSKMLNTMRNRLEALNGPTLPRI